MFAALAHPIFNLKNTHVLLGDTSHAPLKQKFTMPYSKLKVQSVHEYVYCKNDVTVGYHGGIENTAT